MSSVGKKILAGAGIVSFFMLLGKGMGFIQKLVIAHEFGTGMEADAFTLAYSSVIFAFCILPIKILAPFLPVFSQRREKEGDAAAWRFASSIGTLTVLIMLAVMVGGLVATPWLVQGAAASKNPETMALTEKLVRVMFPATVFVGVFAFVTLLLNAHKQFAFPAIGETLSRIVAIVTLLVAVRWWGITALAVGFVLGSVLCLAMQAIPLRDKIRQFRFHVDWQDPALKQFLLLIPPIVIGILIAQARTVLDYRFASAMGEGYAASLGFARSFTDTLVLLVPFAVGVVIYPFFSDMAAAENRDGFTNTLMGSMRLIAFLFIPLSLWVAVLREPIVQLAFQRGQFQAESVALTAGPMLYFALGITVLAAEIILMRFYLALKDTWTPAWIGFFCVLVHVGLILCLKEAMLHNSIALAALVSKGVKVLVMFLLLRKVVSGLQLRENAEFTVKTLTAGLLMAAVGYAVYAGLSQQFPAPEHGRKLLRAAWLGSELGVSAGLAFAVFVGTAFLLRVKEAFLVLDFCRSLLKDGLKHRRPGAGSGGTGMVSDA